MKSDPKLRRIFLDLNKRWFGGLLPVETVHLWYEPLGKTAQETVLVTPAIEGEPMECVIKVDPMFYGLVRHTKRDMIHECVHIEQWPKKRWKDHGKKFKARMRQLVEMGAYDNLF
jgi:hypothetical protein